MIKFLLLGLLLPVSFANAQTQIKIHDGNVKFLAIGKPSNLKVEGAGAGPQGEVTIDKQIANGRLTFDLNTLKTGIALRDQHMKEKYLETDKYPDATLQISKLELPPTINDNDASGVKARFIGDLTLKGITKPLECDVEISKHGGDYNIKADFKLKLSDYNITIPKYLGITIAEEVKVSVETKGATLPNSEAQKKVVTTK